MFKLVILVFIAIGSVSGSLLLTSCGTSTIPLSNVAPAQTACQPNTAQIAVGDGFLQILCGCTQANEAPLTVFPTPEKLTCHVQSANTTVFFLFVNTKSRHQIVPTGPNFFQPSAVNNPSVDPVIISSATLLSQPGTVYSFEDLFSGAPGEFYTP